MANDSDVREMAPDEPTMASLPSQDAHAPPSTSAPAPPSQDVHTPPSTTSPASHNDLDAPKTPTGTSAPDANTVGDTNPRPKPHQSLSFHMSRLDGQRKQVVEYINGVPVLAKKDFCKHILPQSPSNEMIAALTESKAVEILRSQVNEARSTNTKTHENIFFRHIEDVIYADILAKGSARDISPTAKISYNPKGGPTSLERENSSIPDCNLLYKDSETDSAKRIHFRDVFATFEFKKTACAQSRQDDFAKVIWTMRHIMREDPRRRFVFGITIEDRETRLWLANRAGVFVSEEFDYIEDLALFLEVLIRFTYASKSELGWDESMLREQRGSNTSYRIRVNDKWYTTEEVLCNLAAEDIAGRATRVWKARDEQGNLVVLKDVWLDEGRMPEHDVQKELLGSEKNERYVQLVKRHLFTIIAHEKLQVDGTVDNTRDTIMRGLSPRKDGEFLKVNVPKPIIRPQNLSGITPGDLTNVQDEQGSIQHRFHYRIVYEEFATPVYDVRDLKDVFQACLDALVVLSFFSKNGWVHRDISAGNVYIYNGRGIVGDLEYAKKMSSGRKYEVRTGTMNFWAIEVEKRDYAFATSRDSEDSSSDDDQGFGGLYEKHSYKQRMIEELEGKGAVPRKPQKPREPERYTSPQTPFFHNPVHDVESLWWILTASIFKNRVVIGKNDVTAGSFTEYRQQLIHCKEIFPSCFEARARADFFSMKRKFARITKSLPPSLTKIVETLGGIRKGLVKIYKEMESDLDSDNPRLHHECYSDVRISKLYSLFESGVEYSEGMTLHEFPPEWMNGVGAEVANAVPEDAGQSSASRKRGSTEQPSGQPPSKLSRR